MEKQTIIYLRTSTEEQNPENQKEACLNLADKLEILREDIEILIEKKSAWKTDKEKDREEFQKLINLIKSGRIKRVIVWDIDRIYRRRAKLVGFFELCKMFKVKVLSVRQQWFEGLLRIPAPFDEIFMEFLIQILGWIAEEESSKRSERVKLAVKRRKSGTYSKFGNKWGRKPINSKRLRERILELRKQGLSFRQIWKHDDIYYYDKNKNKKKPSLATIHAFIKEEETKENRRKEGVQKIDTKNLSK